MRVGPNTYITLSDELKGPRERVLIQRQTADIPFSDLDLPLQELLYGQEEGTSNWEHPDILAGPVELAEELREDNALVQVTVPRSELPAGKLEIGRGFLNVDAIGRELPMVVTQLDGDRVTLSNVACLYRYVIHKIRAVEGRSFAAASFAAGPPPIPAAALDARPPNNEQGRLSVPTEQSPENLDIWLSSEIGGSERE